MIKLDISQVIFIYIVSSAIIILVIWIFSEYTKDKSKHIDTDTTADFIWSCSICLNKYIDSKHEEISVCPVCGSYNKKEGRR